MVTAYWIWPRILTQNLHPLWSSYQSIYLSICLLPAWLFVCLSVRPSVSAPHRHYQLQLELSKQKQSTDKQFTVKPPFTRHAGIGWRILLNWFNICFVFLFCIFVCYILSFIFLSSTSQPSWRNQSSNGDFRIPSTLPQWSWHNDPGSTCWIYIFFHSLPYYAKHLDPGGGCKCLEYFTPEKNDPIWRAYYFPNGFVQPPTRLDISLKYFSRVYLMQTTRHGELQSRFHLQTWATQFPQGPCSRPDGNWDPLATGNRGGMLATMGPRSQPLWVICLLGGSSHLVTQFVSHKKAIWKGTIPVRGLTITIVANYLLTGMILQVDIHSREIPGIPNSGNPVSKKSPLKYPE